MALMDIEDLGMTAQQVTRILRPGGWFLFSILHPCYNPRRSGELTTTEGPVRTVAGYFDEGHWTSETRTGPPGRVGAYHRTLSTYLNTLSEAGLVLECASEPAAAGEAAMRRPIWTEVPAHLIMRWRKPVSGTPGTADR